jgi:hypothetical protein
MSEDGEHRIRQRAYEFWEQEGHPEGRHEHHWQQASQEAGDEMPQQQGDMGAKAPTGEDRASQRRGM